MAALGTLARTLVLIGAVAAAAHGGIALSAPSQLSQAVGIVDPTVLQVGTSFGIAALLAVAAMVLRPAQRVEYHFVRHHEPAEVRRPQPSSKKLRVSKKVRAKVRASSGTASAHNAKKRRP